MKLVAITTMPDRTRRLHILTIRTHHWEVGTVLVALGLRWIWKDRADLLRFR